MKNENLNKLIEEFNKISGVSFVAFNYRNKEGEESRRVINVGVSYEKAKQKDIEILKDIKFIPSEKYTEVDFNMALSELKVSLNKPSENHSKGQVNAYVVVSTQNDGLKWHINNQELYIYGTSVKKTVDVEGVYKEVKSSPKTIAKDEIRKLLHTSKYRLFKIERFLGSIKMNKGIVEID